MSTLMGPYAVLRGKRDLALLFAGQVVSSLGDWLYITALVILAYNLTHSATIAAVLTFVRLLPYAIFLPLAGVLADRFNRKILMITADLGRALCMLGLLFVSSPATLPLAYPLVFISTCLFSVFSPALKSALPGVVGDEEDLVRANTLMGQIDGISFVLGPSLAGVLALLGHLQVAFAINAATYLVSAGTLAQVRIAPRQADDRYADDTGRLAQTLAGFQFLFRENGGVLAAMTLSMAAVYLFMGASWALIVVLAEVTWRIGSLGAGLLNTSYGVGGLIGGFVVGMALNKLRVGTGFIGASVLIALAALFFGLSPGGAWPFAFTVAYGAGDVLQQVFSVTILQIGTPGPLMGRVFGAFEAATITAMLAGTLVTGPLVGAVGPRGATVILAALGIVGLLVFLPRLRTLEAALGVRVFLRRVPVLAPISRTMLDDLAPRLQLERVPANTTIVRQGEHGDKLYIIKDGEVQVLARDGDGREVALAMLGPRDYFGEIALLRDVPRTATVQSCTPVALYSLTRADFQDLLRQSAEVHQAMAGTGDIRYVDTQSRLLARR